MNLYPEDSFLLQVLKCFGCGAQAWSTLLPGFYLVDTGLGQVHYQIAARFLTWHTLLGRNIVFGPCPWPCKCIYGYKICWEPATFLGDVLQNLDLNEVLVKLIFSKIAVIKVSFSHLLKNFPYTRWYCKYLTIFNPLINLFCKRKTGKERPNSCSFEVVKLWLDVLFVLICILLLDPQNSKAADQGIGLN